MSIKPPHFTEEDISVDAKSTLSPDVNQLGHSVQLFNDSYKTIIEITMQSTIEQK